MSFIENVNIVAGVMTPTVVSNIQTVVDTVVPHMGEILQADADAKVAIAKAAEAATNVALTHADVLLTHADVATTNANVELTHDDVLTTNNNVKITNNDVLLTHADVVTCTNKVADAIQTANNIVSNAQATCSEKVTEAVQAANQALDSSKVALACANIKWADFQYSDGDLVINYIDPNASTPSLVDGELILTY